MKIWKRIWLRRWLMMKNSGLTYWLWHPREVLNIRLTTTLPVDSALLLPTNGEALNRRQILLTLVSQPRVMRRFRLLEMLRVIARLGDSLTAGYLETTRQS